MWLWRVCVQISAQKTRARIMDSLEVCLNAAALVFVLLLQNADHRHAALGTRSLGSGQQPSYSH
jgi:hypothetical protein